MRKLLFQSEQEGFLCNTIRHLPRIVSGMRVGIAVCVLGVHLPLIGFFQPLEAQVKIGIGIGAGFIINGYLYHGDTKAAGELGSLRA